MYQLLLLTLNEGLDLNVGFQARTLQLVPEQLVNLKDDAAYDGIKEQLLGQLAAWIASTDDTFPAHPPQAGAMYTT